MFEALNALFLGFHVAASPIYIRTDIEIKLPELGQIAYKEGFKPALFSTPCRYSGVVVAFDRDWTETRKVGDGMEITIDPEPGKLAGHLFLVNKEMCPDAPVRRVSYVYDCWVGRCKSLTNEGMQIQALPLSESGAQFYKMLPQVMKRIGDAATTSPVAKSFLDFNRQAAEAVQQVTVQQ